MGCKYCLNQCQMFRLFFFLNAGETLKTTLQHRHSFVSLNKINRVHFQEVVISVEV